MLLTRRALVLVAVQSQDGVVPAFATGSVSFTGVPVANDIVVINGTTLTFKAAYAAEGDVVIGADADETAANLADAIEDHSTLSLLVDAIAVGSVVTLTAVAAGYQANAITLTKTGSNHTVSGATLSGGVGPRLDPTLDALLAEAPDYSLDVQVLERNNARPSMSNSPHAIGRKLASAKFTTEIRGNGKSQSGSLADAPLIGRLLRGCGFSETALSTQTTTPVTQGGEAGPTVSWAGGGSRTNTELVTYTLTVTTGGASGSAKATITPDDEHGGTTQTGVTLTSGSPVSVGTKGLTLTPSWSGNLVVGQVWTVSLLPKGIQYLPVSTGFEKLSIILYFDGALHILNDAQGTFTISGEAGNYGKLSWTFTGQYNKPTDKPMPAAVYEAEGIVPQQVELARLKIDNFSPVVNAFNFDMGNTVTPRNSANAADGYSGVFISARKPTGGIDPEAELVATEDFWGKLASAKQMKFQMRFGTLAGNRMWTLAPGTQYSGLTYRDRNSARTYDAGLKFPGTDDEIQFLFC